MSLNYLSKLTGDTRTNGASSPRTPQAPAQVVQRLLKYPYVWPGSYSHVKRITDENSNTVVGRLKDPCIGLVGQALSRL